MIKPQAQSDLEIGNVKQALQTLREDLEFRGIEEVVLPAVDEIRDKFPWSQVYFLINHVFASTDIDFKVMSYHYLSLP